MASEPKPQRSDARRLLDHGWRLNDGCWSHPLLLDYPMGEFNAVVADPFVQAGLDRLRAAVRLIRVWCSIGGPLPEVEVLAWQAYYRSAPEMAPIREALGPEGEELR